MDNRTQQEKDNDDFIFQMEMKNNPEYKVQEQAAIDYELETDDEKNNEYFDVDDFDPDAYIAYQLFVDQRPYNREDMERHTRTERKHIDWLERHLYLTDDEKLRQQTIAEQFHALGLM